MVETGPTMRNLSTFSIKIRNEKIELIAPEHVPAFSKKKFLKRENIDPRVFVVLGDNETALSVIDALRTNFTGRIILIPTSTFGAFENVDALRRNLGPLSKNQCFYVEDDFLDRANIDIMKGSLTELNMEQKYMVLKGQRKPIYFDKVMVAWGSEK